MTQGGRLWHDDDNDDDDDAIDAISILLSWGELDDDEIDILKHPWRYGEEDHANAMAKLRWGDVKNEEALALIKELHEPWLGGVHSA